MIISLFTPCKSRIPLTSTSPFRRSKSFSITLAFFRVKTISLYLVTSKSFSIHLSLAAIPVFSLEGSIFIFEEALFSKSAGMPCKNPSTAFVTPENSCSVLCAVKPILLSSGNTLKTNLSDILETEKAGSSQYANLPKVKIAQRKKIPFPIL